jgi:hypothetical protein
MRRILAFSVLACLAASPAFAWGTGSGGGTGTGSGIGTGTGSGTAAGTAGTGSSDGHGEADARGFVGSGVVGSQTEGIRWDDELRCPVNTVSCR